MVFEKRRDYNKNYYKNNSIKIRKRSKEYYENNKQEVLRKQKLSNQKNANKIKERMKQYRLKNLDKIKKRKKEYWQKNKHRFRDSKIKYNKEYGQRPEVRTKRKEYMKEYEKNPKIKIRRKEYLQRPEVKKRIREWNYNMKKTNPEFNLKWRIRERVRFTIKKYIETGKTMDSKAYGIEIERIIEVLKPFPKNIYQYHIDHIKPLCSFTLVNENGEPNLEQIKEAFAPENHQWLLAKDNLIKGGKY